MPGLRLYTSNRLEILVDELAETLGTPLPSPLDPEIIVVQSGGMARWVSMQLARRHGICANCRFPFPNHFVHEVFNRLLPDLPEKSPFDPKTMTWRIMKILPSLISVPGFEPLRGYLKEGSGQLKGFQLSGRIADLFDQYLLFRPEMIFKWEKGQENHWQAVFWRALIKECGNQHRATLGRQLFKAIDAFSSIGIRGLPERVSVFGISALPRFHMEILSGIARSIQVSLFVMNPCRQYWGDILSEWEMTKKTVSFAEVNSTPEDLHLETGNSLLASMGTLGREFFDLINEFPLEESSAFLNPDETNLLSHIQSDILNIRDAKNDGGEKRRVIAGDASIQIHACHGPMREIEVLHDQLLYMFEQNPKLVPRDILVMTPDIELYAPYIQAVFDITPDAETRIPFSIADRSIRRESTVADAFLAILDLADSRLTAPQVLRILESAPVRHRFNIRDSDLGLIRRWVKDTRIRWGIDEKSRMEMGLPGFSENTWRTGLDRLLLGYALPGNEKKLFGGILPYDFVEGTDSAVLGKLCEFTDRLFSHVKALDTPRTPEAWSASLVTLLDALLLPDEDSEREMLHLRRRLNDLSDIQSISGFDQEIDITVIRWHLAQSLEKEGFGFGFITGGVTFCAMLPMRSIPFKVICLVGMDNDAYPRQATPLGFDLIAARPRPGDRSRRNDDRYLFLEAMLSARKKFYISYVGQSLQDNSLMPPSVLVSELSDYIEQGFEIPGTDILKHIHTTHRLQAFSPEYFKDHPKLFSYSRDNFEAAKAMSGAHRAPAPFIARGLSEPEDAWKTIELDDLCRFFRNPIRFLIQKRLDIYLQQRDILLEERENFELKGIEKYLFEQRLVKAALEGVDLSHHLRLAKASGQLPHGTPGECVFERLAGGVEHFTEQIKRYVNAAGSTPGDVDLRLGDFRLTGRLETIYPKQLIQYRYARVTPEDRIKIWIHHLVLNTSFAHSHPRTSMLVGLSPPKTGEPVWAAWKYAPVNNGEEILKALVETYWVGLKMPVRFFPKSSWDYTVTCFEKQKPHDHALQAARNTWMGNDYVRGECEDPYYQLCFRNTDPLNSEFEQTAMDIFTPLLAHQKEVVTEPTESESI